ncbi:ABC transporter permease [Spiroplasma gladiatoris]|uniref:ABC transporter permease n=1 Tax=Spiroplasma gladiatoris TaxID=2143 RepID=A0A4P7AJD3_9MOLU|nr:FtsX-like permease family protein [Spiroplasma gladiatoris]QBQ07853.1 ABC transporter permease [Spiroplasma gladiatoris]
MLTSIFSSTFSLLLSNSIYVIFNKEKLNINDAIQPLTFFNGLVAITFFISILSLYSIINLSIKLRLKEFILLRIIGFSSLRIKMYIFLEIFIISFITIFISVFLANPIANKLLDFLKSKNVIENNFKIFKEFQFQWVYILITIFVIIAITFFATIGLKNINITLKKELKAKENKKVLVFKSIFAIIFLLISFAIVGNQYTMEGDLGIGLIVLAIINFLISFSFFGKYLLSFVTKTLYLKIKNYNCKIIFGSILKNCDKLIFPITLLLTCLMFSSYVVSLTTFMPESNKENYNSIYISYLLLVVIFSFSFLIFTNSLILYFFERKKEFIILRKVGYTKSKIFLLLFNTSLFISIFTLIINLIIYSFFVCMYSVNNFSTFKFYGDIKAFLLLNFVILVLVNLLSLSYFLIKIDLKNKIVK